MSASTGELTAADAAPAARQANNIGHPGRDPGPREPDVLYRAEPANGPQRAAHNRDAGRHLPTIDDFATNTPAAAGSEIGAARPDDATSRPEPVSAADSAWRCQADLAPLFSSVLAPRGAVRGREFSSDLAPARVAGETGCAAGVRSRLMRRSLMAYQATSVALNVTSA